jgi:catechol 2,3-dioxygenase-like lactoylglutathione lyase family enzyme
MEETMNKPAATFSFTDAYSGFAVDDLDKAKDFYGRILGLEVSDENGLGLKLPGGTSVFIYPKPDHKPAVFTILNFNVADIEAAVDALVAQGVVFERYEDLEQDERGINRQWGPSIAWFTDPAGNILSLIQE